jgi:hypothetical protein
MPEKNTAPLLSPKFALALQFANEIHSTQTRKGLGAPYISHLMAVSALVLEFGGREEHAIGALLHDAAEDCGGRPMLETVRLLFGEKVAEIVEGCTDTFDDPKPAWKPRKEAYIAHLEEASDDVKLVAAADKLHNLACTYHDIQAGGMETFSKFTTGKDEQIWYYRACLDGLKARGKPLRIFQAYEEQVRSFETLLSSPEIIAGQPKQNAFNADADIRNKVANNAIKGICERAKRRLMQMPYSGLPGDDANLRNVWEELCVQIQFGESAFWEDYETSVRQVVAGAMLDCQDYEKLAIWLVTDPGFDWRYEDDERRDNPPFIDDGELALFIQRSHLYRIAEHWSNTRIRSFMDGRFEYDGLEAAGEIDRPDNETVMAVNEIEKSSTATSQVRQNDECSQTKPYLVLVDDNFHYMDADERWTLGRYETLDDAVAACKQRVDECLSEHFQPGITTEALYSQYTSFGDDPFIIGSSQRIPFSAWDYAKQRCAEIAGTPPAGGKG